MNTQMKATLAVNFIQRFYVKVNSIRYSWKRSDTNLFYRVIASYVLPVPEAGLFLGGNLLEVYEHKV